MIASRRISSARSALWLLTAAKQVNSSKAAFRVPSREGCGVRKTSRLTGVHRDTVTRYSRLAGKHAHDVHDELVAFSPEDP